MTPDLDRARRAVEEYLRALGLDPVLGRAQALVQMGEGAFEAAQGLGRAGLRLIQTGADLAQQVRARAGTGQLLDRVHALAQFVDAGALALLDVVEAARQGADPDLAADADRGEEP